MKNTIAVWAAAVAMSMPLAAQLDPGYRVRSLKVEVLSTMLASDQGIGEWGFAAVVEADGHRILVDTGARPGTVLNNAAEFGVNLANITDVVLTHNHSDHTGGLLTLRRAMMEKNPQALSRVHTAKGILLPRRSDSGKPIDFLIRTHREYEATGGRFLEYDRPVELWNGIWLTGPVPRKYPERNWSGHTQIQTVDGWKEDTIPEDMSLVINTDQGLVVVSGCGHAGIINTLDYARTAIRNAPIHAAIGGFHLYQLDDQKLEWTAAKLREFGVANLLGVHCTGIEAVYRIRALAGLDRRHCSVGAVGAVYELGKSIDPGSIAR